MNFNREQRMILSHEAARHRLAADVARLREALYTIEALASASTIPNAAARADTLRDIARLARVALVTVEPENVALRAEINPQN